VVLQVNHSSSAGPEKSNALPAFHAFTGCDNVSSFSGKGEKTAFEVWRCYPDATKGFLSIAEGNPEEAVRYIEKFVVLMYNR